MDEIFIKPISQSLSIIDFVVVAVAAGLLFIIAYLSGKKEEDTGDFFLGKRRVPAPIACLSFVSAEVSAITITSVPAVGYSENLQYLQFFIGSALARIFVAFMFIPVFYKYNCTSIYEFLRHRFGRQTQYAGSIFFFITRLVGSGVRLYAACLAVSLIMGWNLAQTLLLFTVVSIVLIAFGGIKAVVWTGAYEAVIFYLTGIILIGYIFRRINGGLIDIWHIAGQAGRLSIFNFSLNLNDPTTFWAGVANAFFIGLAIFGTDQELVQRLLTVDTRRTSQRTIISTIFASFPITCIYLFIGTLLFVFYKQNPQIAGPAQTKEVLSSFVANVLPYGLKGLVLATIILASIDSPLSSLASSFVTDIYRPLINPSASEKHYLLISRAGVAGFGIVLAAIAFACQPVQSILWFAFQIVSVTGGAMLGIFLLGVLTNCKSNRANVVAMVTSAFAVAVLLVLSKSGVISLGWSWLIVIGTVTTFTLAYLFGLIETSIPANRTCAP
jgi:SSS family transporter